MIAKCRQATRRQSRLTWCIEVIAVSAVVTDTARRYRQDEGQHRHGDQHRAKSRCAANRERADHHQHEENKAERRQRWHVENFPPSTWTTFRTGSRSWSAPDHEPGIASGNTEYNFDVASVAALA
jgi:hypothetical protein